MTVRRVEIRLTSTGFAELSKSLDQIDLKLDKLKAKFDELSKKVISPKVEISDLAKSDAELDKFSLKLDEIGRKRVTAHVGVNVDSGSVRRDAGKLLGDTGKSGRSLFDRLFHLGGGGGSSTGTDITNLASGGGGAGGGILSAVGGANNSYFGGLIAALIGAAAVVSPSIIPFGIGSTVGLGAGGGAYALGSAEHQKLLTLQQSLLTARGKQAKALQAQIAAIQKGYGPELGLYGAVGQVGHSALGVFNTALTSRGSSFVNSPLASANSDIGKFVSSPSFIQGLDGILKQVGGFIKSIGPQLGEMFRASLPFISAFAKIMEQLAKALMPAFTQTMKELQPYLPQIIQGFKYLSMGIATFIKNLGPGMKDAAIIFKAIMAGIGGTLGFLGTLFAGLAIEVVKVAEGIRVAWHRLVPIFDDVRHEVAVIFDGMRHEVVHIMDVMWNDSLGAALNFTNRIARDISNWRHDIAQTFDGLRHDAAAIWDNFWSGVASTALRGLHEDISQLDSWRHDIANLFDGIRHDIATIWDNAWHDLINAGKQFAGVVINGFKTLAAGIWNVVRHIPGQLYNLGKEALSDLWHGMESVWSSFWGWLKNTVGGIVHSIEHFLHMSPPHPGSAFYDLGVNMMTHLEHGLKSKITSVQSAATGSFKAVGGSVVGWIKQAMADAHAPASWLPALEKLVSLESGGNPRAIDPIAIAGGQHATGLWQMLPSTFSSYSRGGSIYNPVAEGVAAIDYIKANYGSPFSIPGLMSGHYSGYASGGWIKEPVLGVGMRSGSYYGIGENGPEYVSPHGSAAGVTVNVYAHPSNNPNEIATEVWTMLRNLKRNRGNQALGLA